MNKEQYLTALDGLLQWMENAEANYSVFELRKMSTKAREILSKYMENNS